MNSRDIEDELIEDYGLLKLDVKEPAGFPNSFYDCTPEQKELLLTLFEIAYKHIERSAFEEAIQYLTQRTDEL